MIDTNYHDLVKEHIKQQHAEAEYRRLVKIAQTAQSKQGGMAYIRNFIKRIAANLEQHKPEVTEQQPEFEQKPASSTNS